MILPLCQREGKLVVRKIEELNQQRIRNGSV